MQVSKLNSELSFILQNEDLTELKARCKSLKPVDFLLNLFNLNFISITDLEINI